jgi:hypothetical protein
MAKQVNIETPQIATQLNVKPPHLISQLNMETSPHGNIAR